jgi:hypothetical protein
VAVDFGGPAFFSPFQPLNVPIAWKMARVQTNVVVIELIWTYAFVPDTFQSVGKRNGE